jgi:acetolactate synthase-1/2/3 large subunit
MVERSGAESLLQTAAAAGVELCFANPGTSEMPVVAALDRVARIRAVLATFEGVCTGAADGYGRMADRPALTLLHHGPGFANGIANLHNAWRARSPLLNLVGDHPDRHLPFDAPLTSDIESLARPCSDWVRRASSVKDLASDAAEALAVAGARPGRVATLVVPSDLAAEASPGPVAPRPPAPTSAPPGEQVESIAAALRGGEPAAILLGALGMREPGLRAAARVAAATGARLIAETFPSRLERGAGLPSLERLPYFPEHVLQTLGEVRRLVLAGAPEPVGFFAYPGLPSRLVPEGCEALVLAEPREDAAAGLEALADALGAPARGAVTAPARPDAPDAALDPPSLGAALAAVQPEDAIVVEEAATSGGPWFGLAAGAPPHTYLGLTGGAIGEGLPVATGAALACPERPVIAFQADGGGLYTLQSLWTQAREGLDVTNIICSNRAYRILQFELARAGVAEPGPKAASLTDLTHPELDWVALARGFGVPGERVERAPDLVRAVKRALAEPGPHLVEAVL